MRAATVGAVVAISAGDLNRIILRPRGWGSSFVNVSRSTNYKWYYYSENLKKVYSYYKSELASEWDFSESKFTIQNSWLGFEFENPERKTENPKSRSENPVNSDVPWLIFRDIPKFGIFYLGI